MSYGETRIHNLSLDSYTLCLQSFGDSDGQIIRKKYNLKPIPMASQVHINSLNKALNFKPRFENLKPMFQSFKPRFERIWHINSSNQGLKFQTGILAGQMHINSSTLV